MAPEFALAYRFQKVHVLFFWGYIPVVCGGHSVHAFPTAQDSTSPESAHRTNLLGARGRNFWSGGVDNLEWKIVGTRLGHCRKFYAYPDISPTIYHPRSTRLGPLLGLLICRTNRTSFIRLA